MKLNEKIYLTKEMLQNASILLNEDEYEHDKEIMTVETLKKDLELTLNEPVSEEEISKIFEKLESKKLIKIQNKKKGVRQ